MLFLPKVKRSEPCAFISGIPIAIRTWEGDKSPLEQAEPLEQQMPDKSKLKRSDSPSINSNVKLALCGKRLSRLPFRITWLIFD